MKTTIDAAGRLVIPKTIRDMAGLTPGVELEIDYRDGKVEIEPVELPIKLVRKGSLLVATRSVKRKMTSEDVNKVMQAVRERRI